MKLVLRKDSLPSRSEICHRADCFDGKYCSPALRNSKKWRKYVALVLSIAPTLLVGGFVIYRSYGRRGLEMSKTLEGIAEFLLIVLSLILSAYLFDRLSSGGKQG